MADFLLPFMELSVLQTKNNRAMKTSQLFAQDNNGSISTLHTFRFDSCKAIASKRTPTLRPTLVNPTLKVCYKNGLLHRGMIMRLGPTGYE